MKVLLTGANGHVGGHVRRHLVTAGHEVVATDLSRTRGSAECVRIADLLDRQACYGLVEGVDAVLHFGNHPRVTLPDHQRLILENTAMNTNLFQAAYECGVGKIIYASSIQVVSGIEDHYTDTSPARFPYLPIDHLTPANPRNPYAASKRLGEELLAYYAGFGLQCIALRLPVIWRARTKTTPCSSSRFRPGDAIELYAYLPPDEAAALIGRILVTDLPGYRVRLPARADNYLGRPLPELIRESYSHIPLRKPPEEMDRLIDCTILRDEVGWEPGPPPDPSTTCKP